MREIKFRAWYPGECFQDNKPRMFQEVCIGKTGKVMGLEGGWDYTGDDEKAIPMQYTGLKDKNGTEIYEGDIVVTKELPHNHMALIVVYRAPCFALERTGYLLAFESKAFEYESKTFEVIGNIYENPELLK